MNTLHPATPIKVSIALATYNGAKYLRAQLDSILAQTRLPDEIIARDDGSTDDESTWRILDLYEPKFNAKGIRTQFIRGFDNVGYTRNFEQILAQATGDVIFLSDQDDVWRKDKLERMLSEFESRPNLGLLFTNARLVNGKGKDLGNTLFDALPLSAQNIETIHKGHTASLLLERTLVTGATAAFRRQVVSTALPVPKGWIHDEWLAYSTALGGKLQIDVLDEALIDYRQHDENAIGMKMPAASTFWSANGLRRQSQRSLATRLQRLLHDTERLDHMEPRWVAELEQRRIHAHHRGNLSGNPVKRVWQIGSELPSGRYFKFARGWRSVVSDLANLR